MNRESILIKFSQVNSKLIVIKRALRIKNDHSQGLSYIRRVYSTIQEADRGAIAFTLEYKLCLNVNAYCKGAF